MNSRRAITLGVLLAVAGCLAGAAGPQTEPVTVIVETSANVSQPYTFEVWVMELPANVTMHRSDDRVSTYELGEGSLTYDSGEYHNFTKIDVPDSARLHGRYTLAPGERNRSRITPADAPGGTSDQFPERFAVVIIVYETPTNIPTWSSDSDCDESTLTGIKVTMRYYGIDSAYSCR